MGCSTRTTRSRSTPSSRSAQSARLRRAVGPQPCLGARGVRGRRANVCSPQVVSESADITPAPAYNESTCVQFSRTSFADLSWALSNWTSSLPPPAAEATSPEAQDKEYGKWCGANRGGFDVRTRQRRPAPPRPALRLPHPRPPPPHMTAQPRPLRPQNCCQSGRCSSCDLSKGLTQECLRQCPPVDSVDNACAKLRECSANTKTPAPEGCRPGAPRTARGRRRPRRRSARRGGEPCAGFRCECDSDFYTAVKAHDCHGTGACTAYLKALTEEFEGGARACWGADYSCLHVPCTTAPNGFCKQCGYYKKCHRPGAPAFSD